MSSEKMSAPALDAKMKGNSETLIFTITHGRKRKQQNKKTKPQTNT